MKNNPPCLGCSRLGQQCNRQQPCDICINESRSRCTYKTDNGARWISALTNPITVAERTHKRDKNVDYYNPDARLGCIYCQSYYELNGQRVTCDFKQGGPPCTQCFNRKQKQANRCTNWFAPGKIESVATRMFKIDDENGNIVQDPAKTKNVPIKKRLSRSPNPTGNSLSSSDSNAESDNSEARNIARENARDRLIKHKLPEIFMTAISLTALDTPVNTALLPDPQSYSEAMRSVDKQKWKDAIQAEYDSLLENST